MHIGGADLEKELNLIQTGLVDFDQSTPPPSAF